jgi:hypothetical protein
MWTILLRRFCHINGTVTITIPTKSSLTITLTISTRARSFFHRRQTKIKRTIITTVLKDEEGGTAIGF